LQSRAIDNLGRFSSALQAELAEELPVLDEKWHIMWTHFEHSFGATAFTVPVAKTRIKKARIVGTQFP
jgi:hypothetical protein